MTTAPYATLLEATEDTNRIYLDPAEALKLVKRLRKVAFFLRIEMDLLTQFDEATGQPTRCYNLTESLKVSAEQVTSILEKKVHFNKLKAERGQEVPGKVEVVRMGNCLFFG